MLTEDSFRKKVKAAGNPTSAYVNAKVLNELSLASGCRFKVSEEQSVLVFLDPNQGDDEVRFE